MPAIMILGFDLEITRVMLVAVLGGLLGILMMIPLRRALIVAEHGVLKYPEGTACAESFKAALSHESLALAGKTHTNRKANILYIGAGAVAAGGIISLFRSIPTIWHGLRGGLSDLLGQHSLRGDAPRTDRDLSMRVVVIGCLAIIAVIMAVPQLHLRGNFLGAFLLVLFSFMFVTVSSRLTGEIGSSSTPISVMTVATLLLTCLAFLIVGWTPAPYFVTAPSIGGIVCIAASNGGTTSQDLKTGFLVSSTPRAQQIAILFRSLASALTLGYALF